jgi:asparagine synthase (glutamine-hydrolysing)
MFAFAIWDKQKRSLFIARDRFGIKPFYYRLTKDKIIFASEIKAILEHPGVSRDFNLAGLPEYLAFGYLSGEDTFYRGIKKLMPGHTLEIKDTGEAQLSRYWDLSIASQSESPERSKANYIHTYRELLEDSVRSHMMSDVPIGVFLSGGLDSSAIAALTRRIGGDCIETFSIGYKESAYSELPHARLVAKHINSNHHEMQIGLDEFFAALPKLIWHEDEPITWPSSVALYFLAELAHRRVKVVLTGEGSDETLGGYSRYAFTLKNVAFDSTYRALIPSFVRRKIRDTISDSNLLSAPIRRKMSHTFLGLDGASWSSLYFDNFFSAFSEHELPGLLTMRARALSRRDGDAYKNVSAFWDQSTGDTFQRMLYTDIKTYLVELLMKQDNMSMAASIESRVPFLDHSLVEFAVNISVKYQLEGLSGKHILKEAVADLLPSEIIYRPKQGFPTPWSSWLSGPQVDVLEKMLLEPRSVERGLFDKDAVERLFREHCSGHRDNSDRIWRLLNLELWQRVCLEGDFHDFDNHKLDASVSHCESVAKQ